MEILAIILGLVVIILLVIVIRLLLQPRKVEVPEIQEMEEKLRFALASEASMREVQNDLKNLPNQLLFSITMANSYSIIVNFFLADHKHPWCFFYLCIFYFT